MTYHFGSRSAALALYVFIIVYYSKLFWIINSHQTQPMCWGRRTRVRLIRVLHDSRELVEAYTLLPYKQQCSNHSANHPRKECIRGKITIDKCLRVLPGTTSR